MRRLIPLLLAVSLLAVSSLGADAGRCLWWTPRRRSDKEAVRSLIQKKADVNAAEPDGSTALHWASYRDDLESADLLLRAGAKVNAANDLGATPLWTPARTEA